MKVAQVDFKNFRTFQKGSISFHSNYCTISGHNNAGKSCVVRALSYLFLNSNPYSLRFDSERLNYEEDRTRWAPTGEPIKIVYHVLLDQFSDSALIGYIQRISKKTYDSDSVLLRFTIEVSPSDAVEVVVSDQIDDFPDVIGKDILNKLRSLDPCILHNSTQDNLQYVYFRGRNPVVMYDLPMSPSEKTAISTLEDKLQKQFRKAAKNQTADINSMLAKLSEQLEIELSMPDTLTSRRTPLSINITDKNVELPILEWGSGTQNRTRVIMSILEQIAHGTTRKLKTESLR